MRPGLLTQHTTLNMAYGFSNLTSSHPKNYIRRHFNMAKAAITVLVVLAIVFYVKGQGSVTFFGKNDDICHGDCDKEGTENIHAEDTLTGKRTVDKVGVEEANVALSEHSQHAEYESGETDEVNVIITFVNAVNNWKLKETFTLTVKSLLSAASVPLAIHILGEPASQREAANIINEVSGTAKYRMVNLDIDTIGKELGEIIKPMQHHFSYKPGAYYNHALFFLSIAIHRVLPDSMHKVIMLDADLKFKADIKELYDRFDLFTDTNVIGIGRDLQPVYRHTFWQYRRDNPGTRVGEPPPNGLTGFNSGVLLLHVDKMRKSKLYNELINGAKVKELSEEYHFKGHLGDQDFFSLLSMKYEELFHVLPCVWNRQLCIYWKDKGYQDVFHLYYDCEGDIKIYHGNCGTPIPKD